MSVACTMGVGQLERSLRPPVGGSGGGSGGGRGTLSLVGVATFSTSFCTRLSIRRLEKRRPLDSNEINKI